MMTYLTDSHTVNAWYIECGHRVFSFSEEYMVYRVWIQDVFLNCVIQGVQGVEPGSVISWRNTWCTWCAPRMSYFLEEYMVYKVWTLYMVYRVWT